MTISDRWNADQVHKQMLDLLDEMNRNLKVDAEFYRIISTFAKAVNQLIDKAVQGDSTALLQAERHVRWMKTNYHMTPYQLRLKAPRPVSADAPKSVEEWLARTQPLPAWKKWLNLFVEKVVFVIIGGVVTFVIIKYLLHG